MGKAATIRTSDPNDTYISTTPSSFSFSAYPTPSSPGGAYMEGMTVVTGDGCFGAVNNTGSVITSLELTFQNTAAIQASGVAAAESDIFSDSYVVAPRDPTSTDATYTYVFTDGELAKSQEFVIVEDGVTDPSQFPTVTLTYTTVTPEPASLLLLGTGLGCVFCSTLPF